MIDQRTAPWAALLLRVTLGSLFIAHLYWKFAILPGGLNTWWLNFATSGYPSITPWYCISAEFVGGDPIYPRYLDALGRAVHASFDRGSSSFLGNS